MDNQKLMDVVEAAIIKISENPQGEVKRLFGIPSPARLSSIVNNSAAVFQGHSDDLKRIERYALLKVNPKIVTG